MDDRVHLIKYLVESSNTYRASYSISARMNLIWLPLSNRSIKISPPPFYRVTACVVELTFIVEDVQCMVRSENAAGLTLTSCSIQILLANQCR